MIVLSIAWIVGGGTYEWSAARAHARSKALAEYESCIEVGALTHNLDVNACSRRAALAIELGRKTLWHDIGIVALAPPAALWGVIYFLWMFRTALASQA